MIAPKMHTELNSKFWVNESLDSEIRKSLLNIAKDFIAFTKIKNLKLQDIQFLGSLANYTYHEKSDIDLHIILNLSNFEKHRTFIKEYLQTKKSLWNSTHDITIHGYKVEVYTEDELDVNNSTAKFSLIKNEWILKPSNIQNDKNIDRDDIKKKYQDKVNYILYLEELSNKKDSDYNKIIKDIESFLQSLQESRKESLKSIGEFSSENILYKMLRANGYIKKIKELRNAIYDKNVSIKEKLYESFKSSEYFNFLSRNYDISKAKNIIRQKIQDNSAVIGIINVDDWIKYIQKSETTGENEWRITPGILINIKHSSKVKLNNPVIVIKEKDFVFIIDGWHRLWKAKSSGIKKLPAYLISSKSDINKIKI